MVTLLEAINDILSASGLTPVNGSDVLHPRVTAAKNTIRSISQDLQMQGYWFNTEFGLKLAVSTNGDVIVPQGLLKIDPTDRSSKLTIRGGKLYDPVNHTFNIGKAVEVNVVLFLDLEDLPHAAAAYVRDAAVLKSFVDADGDPSKLPELKDRKAESLVRFRQAVLDNTDVNILQTPFAQALLCTVNGLGERDAAYLGG